jgi:hypothetical protein
MICANSIIQLRSVHHSCLLLYNRKEVNEKKLWIIKSIHIQKQDPLRISEVIYYEEILAEKERGGSSAGLLAC